eukprot:GHVS01087776.1.p5 GENE.GHVS01087776.1~~GHVS01087776.1.p5  ORF type:complete len:118 (+),score=10.83 GHVS01087776.1:980-1333(+)
MATTEADTCAATPRDPSLTIVQISRVAESRSATSSSTSSSAEASEGRGSPCRAQSRLTWPYLRCRRMYNLPPQIRLGTVCGHPKRLTALVRCRKAGLLDLFLRVQRSRNRAALRAVT